MRPIDVVRRVAPHAKPVYLSAFENGDALFAKADITTPQRLAHWLAQSLHETGGLTILEENLSYSAERMTEVWPRRFPTIGAAAPYAHNPRALANKTYGGRMGNRPGTDDGWNYRGRGLMQTTGRDNYREMSKICGVDFEASPDLVISAEHALKPAIAEWTAGSLNAAADRNDITAITRKINGGLNGLDSREAWYRKIRPLIDKVDLAPVQAPQPAPPSGAKHATVFTAIAAASAAIGRWLAGFDWATDIAIAAVVGAIGFTIWLIRRKTQ